jgi:xylulokinase
MRLSLDILHQSGIETRELRVIGGGAKSRAWMQLKADVLGMSIRRPRVTEAGCLGAAMLARAARLGGGLEALARDWARIEEAIEPDAANAAFYRDKFQAYEKLYPALRNYHETIGRGSQPA